MRGEANKPAAIALASFLDERRESRHFKTWRSIAAGLLFPVALLVSPSLSATELSALRIWDSPEYTRAVFEISAPADYKVFHLDNPERIVVDVKRGSLAKNVANGLSGGGGKSLVKSVRSGKPDNDTLRIVLDLGAKARPKSFLLAPAEHYSHRLVVDLFPNEKAPEPQAKVARKASQVEARNVLIAIDAGHGGEDPGAIGANRGEHEKNITLAVARALKSAIEHEPGMSAFLVRDGDYFIPLKRRYEIAREKKADLFVSIHADASEDGGGTGASVFMLSRKGASSQAARMLAQRENQSDLVGGVSLDDRDSSLAAVLLDLSQGATLAASDQVANQVLASLKQVGTVHKRDVQRANFVVLRAPDVPSILVETAYITNPEDAKKLRDPEYRESMAEAMLEGMRNYFRATPPPGSYFALNREQPSQHVVSKGETLAVIAQRHGVTLSALKSANRLRDEQLREGDVLKLPTPSKVEVAAATGT